MDILFSFSPPFKYGLFTSESERAERERKGDLDQFERLDGDRNQTSKNLAVKKVVLFIVCRILIWLLLMSRNS